MVISGEAYIGVNLLLDTLCLAAANRLCRGRARPGRILLSAGLGTVLSMTVLACWGLLLRAHAGLFPAADAAVAVPGRRTGGAAAAV